MKKKLKVFHGTVNYGTQSGIFAKELREKGITALSVTSEDAFKRVTDIELSYSNNRVIKFIQRIIYGIRKVKWFFQFNTFHFYFGKSLFSSQIDLPFYKIFGKKILMEYLGNDIRNYEQLVKRYNLSKEHKFYLNMDEHDKSIRERLINEGKYIDYRICCLPTHIDFAKSYGFKINEVLPLAIDLKIFKFKPLVQKSKKDKIIITHAPTNRMFKGTKYIVDAIDRVKNSGYNIEFRLVEGVSYKKLIQEYEKCDIFIDQISVGWYGTASLEAMAIGRPVCAFIDERYTDYIDYKNEIPVINTTKENIYSTLCKLIENSAELPEIGAKGRKFVENYHSVCNVTDKLIQIYQTKLWN